VTGFTSGAERETARCQCGFTYKNRKPFAFAGLWDCWRDPAGDKELYTFTIITTEANALLRPIHNRMPVIYDKEMGSQWLEESFGDQPMISRRRVAAMALRVDGNSRRIDARQFA